MQVCYFDKPEDNTPFVPATDLRVMISVNALFVLALGVYPGGLMSVCIAALQG